jgi:hypothetical protein
MASGNRPGGLTALAVINFVLGGLSLLGSLGTMALISFLGRIAEQASTQDMTPAQQEQLQALADVGSGTFILLLGISLISAILLIVSGIGYLKLKKFLGRTLGTTYAIVGIVSSASSSALMPENLGGGFNIMVIVGLIYPVLTLILLNLTFKEDFVN